MWLADTVVGGAEFIDTVGLAFECDDAEIVAIKEREHVTMHIKHQYTTGIMKGRERQFLFHVCA
jgi:hypothetical protein